MVALLPLPGAPRTDTHDDRPYRTACRHTLSAADELYPQTVQLIDYLQEIPSAPRNPVECRHQHHREFLSPSVSHECIKPRTACFLPTDATILIFMHHFEASLCRKLSEVLQLTFDMLIWGRNSDVDGGFLHGDDSPCAITE